MPATDSHFAAATREMRRTIHLALPLIFGHVATGMIAFVDSVLAGWHSANTLAAVAVGSAIWSMVVIVLVGVLLSVPPTISQLVGAGRRADVPYVFRQTLWLALGLAAVLVVFLHLAMGLLEPMGIAAEIRPAAREFLLGVRWGVPALALYLSMRYLSEGLHWTIPTMVLGVGGLVLLVPLGYVMMFGKFGIPELGAEGLGFATAIMLWCQVLAFATYLARSPRFSDLALFSRLEWPRWTPIRNLLRLGLPIGVTVALEGGLFVAAALLIGRMGEVPAAAHQIALNIASITFMAALALSEATTVRVGHAAGAHDARGVRHAVLAGYALVILVQCSTAATIALGNDWIASIYTRDAAVLALAAQLLLFAAAFQLSDGIQVMSGAALRGLKDTRVPMLLAALAYWGVGMPVGAGLGLGLGWGAPGMWLGLLTGLTMAATLLALRLRKSVIRLESRTTWQLAPDT
ncbi:MAG TPA: MATE family efflux transporter [Chiayiivirga sp.]|nr:MATE family efflux transporter [Chiayiivirga sp.]